MRRSPDPPPSPSVRRRARLIAGIAVLSALLAAVAVTGVHVLSGGAGSGRSAGFDAVARDFAGIRDPASSPAAATASPSGTASPTPATSTGTPPAAPVAGAAAPPATGSCTNPQFVTSDPSGMWANGGYYVANDMWNSSSYHVSQTLYACAYNNFSVVATMDNASGDGAVKTYPNVHLDFSEPAISSLHRVTSTFAETSPQVGIYEDAYDIWINGVASAGSTEIMIWTENHGQVPSGSVLATVSLGGRSYQVYKSGSYIAFVAGSNFTSGTMDLLAFFNWVIAQGWMPASSTLGQVDYGAELVSTNGAPATFTFTNFSVSAG
jgi:Glycosyl hydrolase family 12